MKNNKGMTLVELIISIILISLIVLFLMVLFINVKDINDEAETNTSYLISKSLIIKEIEDDLETATKINVKNCSITDFYKKSYNIRIRISNI